MSTALTASNKETFRRLLHVLNSCDPELIEKAVDEFVAPDALIRTPLPIDATGAELAKQVWRQLLQAFPDLHVTVEDLIAEDDKVVCRNTVTGTHKGEAMGLHGKAHHVRRDLHLPLRRWPHRRVLGGREHRLDHATARHRSHGAVRQPATARRTTNASLGPGRQ